MITGTGTADREAVVELLVHGPTGERLKIEAVIDAGFDGWLSLPPDIIESLELPLRRRGLALLADGSESVFDIFDGTIAWHGRRRRIPIDQTRTAPLFGMALLEGFELRIEVRTGGNVSVSRLA